MAMCCRRLMVVLALVIFGGPLGTSAEAARGGVIWAPKRFRTGCEPPADFYSSRHVAGRLPCCPTVEGLCAGGDACPVSGVCPADGKACKPGAVAARPNMIMFVSDDQGDCAYGSAQECRSAFSGTPIPAPKTPSLDVLAGYGTVFPVVHNTSSWCFPSLATILSGRYQRSMHGSNKILETAFSTMPSSLRALESDPTVQVDPYNVGNAIGGYCTLLGGKFTGSLDKNAFDGVARTARKLGRNDCVAGTPAGSSPNCGASISTASYNPTAFVPSNRIADVFSFLENLIYQQPGSSPAQYAMQHFFIWYAPRVPHQPLRSPKIILEYLFGGASLYPRGGVMNLGQWCTGSTCPSTVEVFRNEGFFGTMDEYYGNLWWADDNVRELRRFLAAESTPHCIDSNGRSRFDITNPLQCPGTWTAVSPDLPRNTIFLYFSDNGWQLPESKHHYTENGYRTRLIVFDPRTLPEVPHWDPEQATPPPPRTVEALGHSSDMLPTALGFALGTSGSQACPVGPDGQACDGHDLGGHLFTTPGGPAAPETLRHSLCGHQTQRPTSPSHNRYLLTRPGSVGRCTKVANAACATSAQCQMGEFCVGGHCAPSESEISCSAAVPCPAGAACLGGKCRMAPPCFEDSDCDLLVGPGYACAGQQQRWCRNAPNAACTTANDCPVCPSSNGVPLPCGRTCEARMMKLYVSPGPESSHAHFLTDLFLDPDEHDLYSGDPKDPSLLLTSLSDLAGPYGPAMRRMNCCIDDWWPEEAQLTGTLCSAGYSCPADLVCNQ